MSSGSGNPQAESVIRNIIREICLECSSQGENVSETLAAFMVKAAVLDPDNDFNVERTLTKEDVQKLIQTCVGRLLVVDSPSLDTIKMQVHFDMNYSTREEFLQEHHRVLEVRLQAVVREITDARARSREELEGLYRKIVSYVLLRSGLGSPTDISVVREATAALQSVFPQTELGSFMALPRPDKEQQLKELTNIVTGIRLFNRDSGKGGEGVDDLPQILRNALHSTSNTVDAEMRKTLLIVHQLTSVLLGLLESATPPSPSCPPVSLMKDSLINMRQMESYIKVLMHDIVMCASHLDQLDEEFQSYMATLRETVQAKTAVPTSQVYPLFSSLSRVWSGFQDEVVLLSVLSTLISGVKPFTKSASGLVEGEGFQSLLASTTILSDEERKAAIISSGQRVNPDKHRKADFLFPETTRDFDRLPLEFKGYCGYHLTVHDRLLIPAVPALGVLNHKGRCYAFYSKEAADSFASNPDRFLSSAVECGKRSPELIQLLDMHMHFSSATPGIRGGAGNALKAPVTKCDSGTQTDTHFMETNIVKSYEWNEWELRRKAVKLANIRQKITHSVQTDLSHFKRENTTQVNLPKTQWTQTTTEGSTSVPKPVTYIAGLRGRRNEFSSMIPPKQKIDLTLPVEQHNNITT